MAFLDLIDAIERGFGGVTIMAAMSAASASTDEPTPTEEFAAVFLAAGHASNSRFHQDIRAGESCNTQSPTTSPPPPPSPPPRHPRPHPY